MAVHTFEGEQHICPIDNAMLIRVLAQRKDTVRVLSGARIEGGEEAHFDLVWTRKVAGGIRQCRVIVVYQHTIAAGYFVFELVHDVERGELGWLWESEADDFLFIAPEADMLYVFPAQPLRDWLTKARITYRTERIPTHNPHTNVLYTSEVIRVPKDSALRSISGTEASPIQNPTPGLWRQLLHGQRKERGTNG